MQHDLRVESTRLSVALPLHSQGRADKHGSQKHMLSYPSANLHNTGVQAEPAYSTGGLAEEPATHADLTFPSRDTHSVNGPSSLQPETEHAFSGWGKVRLPLVSQAHC